MMIPDLKSFVWFLVVGWLVTVFGGLALVGGLLFVLYRGVMSLL